MSHDCPRGGVAKYALQEPYVKRVADLARDIVRGHAARQGYAFVDRLKTTTSLAEKIESGRYRTWSELDDCYACAVVVPTLAEEPPVLDVLKSAFKEVAVRGRGSTQKDPQVFRFDATRFIGSLRPNPSIEEASPLASVRFEVQIRTAFEHAWTVTTHSWAYKASRVDWRRMRLVAQLKATVEQLDALVAGFGSIEGTLSEQHWPVVAAQKAIETHFRAGIEAKQIPREVAPESWTRFCQNLFALLTVRPRERDPVGVVTQALGELAAGMAPWSAEQFPRSLSLLSHSGMGESPHL